MSPSPFTVAGAQPERPSRYAALSTLRLFTGIWTVRSPLRDAATSSQYEAWGVRRFDSLIDGENVELTSKLTLARRPGLSVYNNQSFPSIDSFYSFHIFGPGTTGIRVIADTANTVYDATGPSTKQALYTKSIGAGQAYFQSVGNILYFGDGIEQKKWTRPVKDWEPATVYSANDMILDGNLNIQIALGGLTLTITNVQVIGNTAICGIEPTNTILPVGTSVSLSGIGGATFLNGATVTVSAAGSSEITFPFTHDDYTLTPDNGTATVTTGITGITVPSFATSTGALTVDSGQQWLCNGPSVTEWGIGAPTTAPTVVPPTGYNVRFWSSQQSYPISPCPYTLLDDVGNVQIVQSTSKTGTKYPNWNATPNSSSKVTIDGQTSWLTNGRILGAWQANYAFPSFACILDPNNNLQRASQAAGTQHYPDVAGSGYSELTGSTPEPKGKSYTYVIVANFSDGTHTANTNPVTVTNAYSVLGPIPLNGVEKNVISWTDVPNAVSYDIYRTASTGLNNGFSSSSTQGRGATTGKIANVLPGIGEYSDLGAQGDSSSAPSTNTSVLSTAAFQQSGATIPNFNTTLGGTTTGDGAAGNAITWTCLGPSQQCVFTGYKYVYCYHLTSGHVSTASPSTFTGPAFGSAYSATLTGMGSARPDCDYIYIFRTADGGSTYLFLDLIPNPGSGNTWTYNDTATDDLLNEFIQAPLSHSNDAPPSGLVALTYHQGRIWGAVNNLVYASGGPDTITGSGNEAFPPANVFTFPSRVVRLQPYTQGLLVFTVSDVYVILGQGAITNFYSVPFIKGYGLLSYNAFDVNGSTFYMMTSDNQVLNFDPSSGVSDVGFPIGNLFSTYDASNAYVTWHAAGSIDKAAYVADGETGWYRLNPTPAPETGLTWSPKATISGGCKAVQSVETSPGIHHLLVSSANYGPILTRDLSTFTDNGTAYTAFATMGSIVLATHGQMAGVSFIGVDCPKVGSAPTISVLLDETHGEFESLPQFTQDPTNLAPSATLYGLRYYLSQTTSPAWCRHLQVKVSWKAEAQPSELYSFTIYGTVRGEQ